MQVSKKDMERLFLIFRDYIENFSKADANFLYRIYNELDEDCMKYGYKNTKNKGSV